MVASDKNIILAVAELIRTESRKEVLDLLTHVYKCNQQLPRIIVYDAGNVNLFTLSFLFDTNNNNIRLSTTTICPQSMVQWSNQTITSDNNYCQLTLPHRSFPPNQP